MKIIRNDDRVMELSGIPGGAAAIVVPALFALVGMLGLAFGWIASEIPPAIIGGLMLALGASVAASNAVRRERLRIDLDSRRAIHERRSLVGSGRSASEFPLDQVAGVELNRGVIRGPGRSGGSETETWTSRLLIRKPRRVIVLAETQGGSEQSVRVVAEAVAAAIGVQLIDRSADEATRIAPDRIGRPLSAGSLESADFAAPPAGARVRLSVDAAAGSVELTWKTVGGPALPLLGLLVLGGFAFLATVMALEASRVLPVLSWVFGPSKAGATPASPGLTAALAAMTLGLWAIWLGILQTWRWSRRVLTVTAEHVQLRAHSPLAAAGSLVAGPAWARRWRVPTVEVRSVRTHKDALEVRDAAATRRALVHIPVEGEVAWMAKVTRAAVAVLGRQESLAVGYGGGASGKDSANN